MNRIRPYVKDASAYRTPGPKNSRTFEFAFRRRLSDKDSNLIPKPEQVAMIFDSTDTRWNASGELDLLPNPARYKRTVDTPVNIIAFVDGHAKQLPNPAPDIR